VWRREKHDLFHTPQEARRLFIVLRFALGGPQYLFDQEPAQAVADEDKRAVRKAGLI